MSRAVSDFYLWPVKGQCDQILVIECNGLLGFQLPSFCSQHLQYSRVLISTPILRHTKRGLYVAVVAPPLSPSLPPTTTANKPPSPVICPSNQVPRSQCFHSSHHPSSSALSTLLRLLHSNWDVFDSTYSCSCDHHYDNMSFSDW